MDAAELMGRALALAEENAHKGGGPFAALVVHDGKVIGCGANAVVATNDPTAHAEISAIREACRALGGFQLTGCEIYTTCEPCPMCLGAIYWARLDRIWYSASRADAAAAGFDDAYIYDELAQPPAGRAIPANPILPVEGQRPFLAWKANPNRVRY